MKKNRPTNWIESLFFLVIIWLLGVMCDRLWLAIDRSIPAWDPADYLNGAVNYWQALKTPRWFDGDWWRQLWLISPKIPPLTYILTVPFFNLFGVSTDAAFLLMLPISAILLVSVYGLGVLLFDNTVGLLAAGICQLLPGLYFYRLEFLLDYPLSAIVTFSFWLLTVWQWSRRKQKKYFSLPLSALQNSPYQPKFRQKLFSSLRDRLSWLWALLFGLSFGIALMVKQTSLFFLVVPLLLIAIEAIRKRYWVSLIQLIMSLCLSVAVAFPWYRTNWLLMLTSGKRATIDSAIAEGDPALNTLDAWTFYGKILPSLLSWPLLLVPVVGFLIYWLKNFYQSDRSDSSQLHQSRLGIQSDSYRWLLIFLIGGYFLTSFNVNKDNRYITPLLPVLALLLAQGLLCWKGRWRKYITTATVILSSAIALINLFPIGTIEIVHTLSPGGQKYPYEGETWHHEDVIQEIVNTSVDLRSTLAVLPSTPTINQHNFTFYGHIYQSQVVGRQVGVKAEQVNQDARSLDWFVTKTGDQGSVPEAEATIVKIVEESGNFQLQKSWQLPDTSTLKLYHRRQASVEVKPRSKITFDRIQLDQVELPSKTPPGVPVPVTYHWSGNWKQLESGLVILTWEKLCDDDRPCSTIIPSDDYWLHDHAIGMGMLNSAHLDPEELDDTFTVIERTAMFPETDLKPGDYTLKATYLNRQTEQTYPIAIPLVTLTIDPAAKATSAPELDLVTQLRNLAPNLALGIEGLDEIFAQTARINQYDPNQDYLTQAEQSLSYRWRQNDGRQKLNWLYSIALANVLQQDVRGAIASMQDILQIYPQNPFNYTYLAFVYLYDWQPQPAQKLLSQALAINPDIPEIRTMRGVSALMQFNLIQAWQDFYPWLWKK